MKKNRILILFVLVLITFVLFGCTKKKALDAPVISLNETFLTWDEVSNATKYVVKVNDAEFETTQTQADLASYKANSYEIKVKAIGDNKRYLDSGYSNTISFQVQEKVVLEKKSNVNNKDYYNINVQSKEDVLGFTISIQYDKNKLSITSEDITWTNLLPDDWIYDININNGTINIAVTGLEAMNIKFLQSLINLSFQVSGQEGNVTITDYTIDFDAE